MFIFSPGLFCCFDAQDSGKLPDGDPGLLLICSCVRLDVIAVVSNDFRGIHQTQETASILFLFIALMSLSLENIFFL